MNSISSKVSKVINIIETKDLSKKEITQRGGNSSMIHIDWMIGSGKIDVSGKNQNGSIIPIFKQGEWCI